MTTSKTANLVLIPTQGIGHLVPAVELAKQLVSRDPRLSVTVLVMKFPNPDDNLDSLLSSLQSNSSLLNNGVTFLQLPPLDGIHFDLTALGPALMNLYMEAYRPMVKAAVEELRSSGPIPIAGFLLDMFCTPMIDVATDLGLPSYVFFPSNAGLLSMMFRFQELGVAVVEEYDIDGYPDAVVEIPGYRNRVPVRVWPAPFLAKNGGSASSLRITERYRETKGILVNTFTELQPGLIDSLSQDNKLAPIYPVGPILNWNPSVDEHAIYGGKAEDEIMGWLDAQPPRSVVLLCFGSMGSFGEMQVKEIAAGLERSGQRFLWSLRIKPENRGGPLEVEDPSGVLPDGFLERTMEKGKVIGWAPQARVLGHEAVGGFVSHCGWNSVMESLWFGVPIATWPLYAEQQLNAFMLLREMGMAVEIKMDYRQNHNKVVEAAEVEEGIKKVIGEGELREKVIEMSVKARKAVGEGGSSYESLGRFIDSVFSNLP